MDPAKRRSQSIGCYVQNKLRTKFSEDLPISFAMKSTVKCCRNEALSRRRRKTQPLPGKTELVAMIVILVSLLFPAVAFPLSKHNTCDPSDKTTCRFMGKCVHKMNFLQYNQGYDFGGMFKCHCPNVHCYEFPHEPVCAEDGKGNKKTFYNELCRRLTECDDQKQWRRVCRGQCDKSNCRPFNGESNVKICSEELENYCSNGGVCLLVRDGPPDPFCRCPKGYVGPRCSRRLFMRQVETKEIQR